MPEKIEIDDSVIYVLNPELCLVYCNPYWDKFAIENGGERVQRQYIDRGSILDITPPVLRPFYLNHFRRGQEQQKHWEHDYECSSPTLKRLFRMRVFPLGQSHILVENSLRIEEEHDSDRIVGQAVMARYADKDGIVTMCSHCRRTKRSNMTETAWDWVPSYVRNPPQFISHGLCHMCIPLYFGPSEVSL